MKKINFPVCFFILLFILCGVLFYNLLQNQAKSLRQHLNVNEQWLIINNTPEELLQSERELVRQKLLNEQALIRINALSIIILIFTAYILGLTAHSTYQNAKETRTLSKLTEKQININIRPFVIVTAVNYSLRIKNIGKNPALNIRVDDLIKKDVTNEEGYKFSFSEVTLLDTNEEKELQITTFSRSLHQSYDKIRNSRESDRIIQKVLFPQNLIGNESYILTVEYDDIEGGIWRSETDVSNGGIYFCQIYEA